MTADLEPVIYPNILELLFGFKPFKIDTYAALGAGEEVLVSACSAKNGLALPKIMDAVNEMEVFQLFDRAVDRDQTQIGF